MKSLLIGGQTFKEIYKSKILFGTLLIGLFLLLMTFVVAEFSYGVPGKVTLDIGLGLISLSGVSIALFLGARLLPSEIENRTLYMVLSRPVSRKDFLIGKMIGLSGILLANLLFLYLLLYGLIFLLGGKTGDLLGWSLFFIFIESLLVMLMVVFFSLISNTIISIIMTLTLFVAGHGVETVKQTSLYLNDGNLKVFIDLYSQWMPNFNAFNIKSFVLYEKFIEPSWLLRASSYASLWCLLFLILSVVIFNKRELT